VFARVLELDRVGAEADFFALGGTSLDAARAVQELRAATARDVPLRLLYTRSTVALLAEALEAETSAA
jgi:acyl carrier protein